MKEIEVEIPYRFDRVYVDAKNCLILYKESMGEKKFSFPLPEPQHRWVVTYWGDEDRVILKDM